MMRQDRIDDFRSFFVLAGDFCTQRNVRTFHLEIGCFANVMEQSTPFGHHDIQAEFSGHHASHPTDLNRVLQDILTVTGAVAQTAEQFDDSGWIPIMPVSKRRAHPPL